MKNLKRLVAGLAVSLAAVAGVSAAGAETAAGAKSALKACVRECRAKARREFDGCLKGGGKRVDCKAKAHESREACAKDCKAK